MPLFYYRIIYNQTAYFAFASGNKKAVLSFLSHLPILLRKGTVPSPSDFLWTFWLFHKLQEDSPSCIIVIFVFFIFRYPRQFKFNNLRSWVIWVMGIRYFKSKKPEIWSRVVRWCPFFWLLKTLFLVCIVCKFGRKGFE